MAAATCPALQWLCRGLKDLDHSLQRVQAGSHSQSRQRHRLLTGAEAVAVQRMMDALTYGGLQGGNLDFLDWTTFSAGRLSDMTYGVHRAAKLLFQLQADCESVAAFSCLAGVLPCVGKLVGGPWKRAQGSLSVAFMTMGFPSPYDSVILYARFCFDALHFCFFLAYMERGRSLADLIEEYGLNFLHSIRDRCHNLSLYQHMASGRLRLAGCKAVLRRQPSPLLRGFVCMSLQDRWRHLVG